MGRSTACMGEIGNACKVLVRKPEREGPFGEPDHG
jgi:hypothetical protein